jgi:rubrerythrin
MTLKDLIQTRYIDRLLASPKGRTYVLRQASAAEDTDEGRFFDELEKRVDDDELRRMIQRHKSDEARHARMFADAADRVGGAISPLPEELMLLPRLDRALGGFFDRMSDERLSVMEAYLLLQVIEERATAQFEILEPIMRRHDPAAADILREITADEERHLKYCRAIARRYAPDDATLERTLHRYRDIEAKVFVEHGRANMAHALDHGYLAIGKLGTMFWRGVQRLLAQTPAQPDHTRFWTAAPAAV